MNLVQSYYIEKRNSNNHISLDGQWDFCYEDNATDNITNLKFEYTTLIPSSIYYSLFHAGILPDPYYGTNSKKYHWVDEKVWYYRKKFVLTKAQSSYNAYLCFDGLSYYSRVWVNGNLLGTHEGMFGGPCCDIQSYLKYNEENEIIVEVKACNFGKKEGYDFGNWKGQNTAISPWNITRDSYTSNGDFIVIGIWNHVRLELLNKIHISRPYMYTKNIDENKARIHFEAEISDGSIKELRQHNGIDGDCYYTRAYDTGLTEKVKDKPVQIKIKIFDDKNIAYDSIEDVALTDFEALGMNSDFLELQFYQKEIVIENPKLWYPNGLGEAFLYDVEISVLFDGIVTDTEAFKFGIRTFDESYTKGNKYRHRWNKFLFSINGEDFFLKGMNWAPMDFLYDIAPDRYEWCLNLAKNAGIQLLRVWNGGGMPESDTFYELCDKLGILVWQDQFIANTNNSQNLPHRVLESQISYNLYRTRNHPSLVILCGGNEFNPYTENNAASMFVTERTVEDLAPDKIYHYTTADKGSAHIYIDMEPVWYRHRYKQLPFIAESGMHSFPNYKTLKQFIDKNEASSKLPDLSSNEFIENYPGLLNHFSEYVPERVPRMTARISQVIDMSDISLIDICEASQVQVFEFYQLMIQAMQENYPVCGGIMPWVFKRPWVTAGIQTVDGDDRPCLGYYSVLNAYKPVNICWCQEWSILAPGEELNLTVKVFNQNNEDLSDTKISLTVYNPDLTVFAEYTSAFNHICDFGSVKLSEQFTNTCFLVCADISKDNKLINRTVYFNKCTDILNDKDTYEKYRSEPCENLRFENGPWLKPSIQNANQAKLEAHIIEHGFDGKYNFSKICIKNISQTPAYPVTIDLCDDKKRFFLDDNFFMLKPGEEKNIRITCDRKEANDIKIDFWNGNPILI